MAFYSSTFLMLIVARLNVFFVNRWNSDVLIHAAKSVLWFSLSIFFPHGLYTCQKVSWGLNYGHIKCDLYHSHHFHGYVRSCSAMATGFSDIDQNVMSWFAGLMIQEHRDHQLSALWFGSSPNKLRLPVPCVSSLWREPNHLHRSLNCIKAGWQKGDCVTKPENASTFMSHLWRACMPPPQLF